MIQERDVIITVIAGTLVLLIMALALIAMAVISSRKRQEQEYENQQLRTKLKKLTEEESEWLTISNGRKIKKSH